MVEFLNSFRNSSSNFLLVCFLGLLAILIVDISGVDLIAAGFAGGYSNFPLRDASYFKLIFHDFAKIFAWCLLLYFLTSLVCPKGSIANLSLSRRIQIPVTALSCVAIVAIIKAFSRSSCPWEVDAFGGVIPYVSHWNANVYDGGGGRCFPAGHASAGFAFLGAYFSFKSKAPKLAVRWLIFVIFFGFALGISQQMRGAHYLSHTLWTFWICWVFSGIIDLAVAKWSDNSNQLIK